MRNILGFYRSQNDLEKVKLWPFEKLTKILALFPKRPLIIAITSYVMILWPMFLYSFESWDHEDYFRLLQTSKRFRKSEVMTIWKLTQILVLLPHFFLSPIFCISFGTPPPYVRKKISQTVYSCTRYRSSLVTVWLIFFSHFGRVCYHW